MTFTATKLPGAFLLDVQLLTDDRGAFARTFCAEEFRQHGLDPRAVQSAISFNQRRGTLRGMHWQVAPHAQSKLVRVTHGAIHDVIVDLRPGSPTFRQHLGVELSAANRRMLFVPEGFAHGFQTLADGTELFYQFGSPFVPGQDAGARWNDPAFGITWPLPDPIMNERDKNWPDFAG
ncbi:MAG: dTDP-4-dehydrorhamnose 3,5-epimerase [Verrucomicrobia bacterium]|nr:dTDP-4-dehydrorhamnose 3,5-epimerase [Verrucomicrobiota bacterium]